MARLNTRTSATPLPPGGRSVTVDSLYRDPTPLSQVASRARQSTYSVMSPATNSDKENEHPESPGSTPQPPSKSRRPMGAPSTRLPTPQSGSSAGNANKRRRTDDYSAADSTAIYADEDEDEDEDEDAEAELDDAVQVELDDEDEMDQEEDESEDENASASASASASAAPAVPEDEVTKYYDPDQDPEIRRQLRANIRNHRREIEDNRDVLVQPGNNGLIQVFKKQDYYMEKVRQTADAVLDAQVLTYGTELAAKRLNNSLNGHGDIGVDVDQFVSRCIQFMRSGGDPSADVGSSTQARRDGEDEEDEDDDGLDWAFFGREVCFSANSRPPTSSFLLGPLSVQQRARPTQARRARSQKQPTGPATRPQELQQSDIKQSENSNLVHLVSGIRTRLEKHLQDSEAKVIEDLTELDASGELGDADNEAACLKAACQTRRICRTAAEESAVHLFDFVVNPHSFGQTVENLFYVSFLIREGSVKVVTGEAAGDDGLPVLAPPVPAQAMSEKELQALDDAKQARPQKHQAVFSLDWPTWKKLIKAFDIKEPLIPHRAVEESNVNAGGWYG
ncbi:Nse4-domain-containing protein [Lophiostoma macrostomum CBS 122681]|uniref:Non-structural maintenance of chromosomes element 4 n=1 Tax=Lophiostoma macrostomum CBS 122681 TaxID=1314788 RepID=A0A6A6SNR8_9PLEO|nr:Nse4-domain-containing protein [Lophiostoma macrostomum CBS 122681]